MIPLFVIVQSVTELCIVEDSNTEFCIVEDSDKNPAAEARANSVESRGKVLLKLAIVASMSVVLGLATMLKLKWLQSVKIDIIWRGSRNV